MQDKEHSLKPHKQAGAVIIFRLPKNSAERIHSVEELTAMLSQKQLPPEKITIAAVRRPDGGVNERGVRKELPAGWGLPAASKPVQQPDMSWDELAERVMQTKFRNVSSADYRIIGILGELGPEERPWDIMDAFADVAVLFWGKTLTLADGSEPGANPNITYYTEIRFLPLPEAYERFAELAGNHSLCTRIFREWAIRADVV